MVPYILTPHSRFASNWPLHWSEVSFSSTSTTNTSFLTSAETLYSVSRKTQGADTDHRCGGSMSTVDFQDKNSP